MDARLNHAVPIVGPPGAGKSTVLEALGTRLEIADVPHGRFEVESLGVGWPWLGQGELVALLLSAPPDGAAARVAVCARSPLRSPGDLAELDGDAKTSAYLRLHASRRDRCVDKRGLPRASVLHARPVP